MGHYVACRRYDVDATLPFFLPFPSLRRGRMGAVIKIREPFPTRAALFDIGVAGPIGGFVVLVPLLFFGHALLQRGAGARRTWQGCSFGEPLLFRLASWLQFGAIADGYRLNIHPIVLRRVVRDAGDGVEPAAVRPARWRPPRPTRRWAIGRGIFSLATVAGAIVMCFVSYQLAADDGDDGGDARTSSARGIRACSNEWTSRSAAGALRGPRLSRVARCFVLLLHAGAAPNASATRARLQARSSDRRRRSFGASAPDARPAR